MVLIVLVLIIAIICGLRERGPSKMARTFGGLGTRVRGGARPQFRELGADDDEIFEEALGEGKALGGGPFRLSIRDPWYTMMLDGEKRVEGRLDRKPFDSLKEGDEVTVVRSRPKGDTSEYPGGRYKYNTRVKRVKKYKDFAALLKGEKAEKVYPGKSASEATDIFKEFLPPTADADSPVLAIELEAPPKQSTGTVKSVRAYENIEDFLDSEDVGKLYPGKTRAEMTTAISRSLPLTADIDAPILAIKYGR